MRLDCVRKYALNLDLTNYTSDLPPPAESTWRALKMWMSQGLGPECTTCHTRQSESSGLTERPKGQSLHGAPVSLVRHRHLSYRPFTDCPMPQRKRTQTHSPCAAISWLASRLSVSALRTCTQHEPQIGSWPNVQCTPNQAPILSHVLVLVAGALPAF